MGPFLEPLDLSCWAQIYRTTKNRFPKATEKKGASIIESLSFLPSLQPGLATAQQNPGADPPPSFKSFDPSKSLSQPSTSLSLSGIPSPSVKSLSLPHPASSSLISCPPGKIMEPKRRTVAWWENKYLNLGRQEPKWGGKIPGLDKDGDCRNGNRK